MKKTLHVNRGCFNPSTQPQSDSTIPFEFDAKIFCVIARKVTAYCSITIPTQFFFNFTSRRCQKLIFSPAITWFEFFEIIFFNNSFKKKNSFLSAYRKICQKKNNNYSCYGPQLFFCLFLILIQGRRAGAVSRADLRPTKIRIQRE